MYRKNHWIYLYILVVSAILITLSLNPMALCRNINDTIVDDIDGFDIAIRVTENIVFGKKHITIIIEAHNRLNKTVYITVLEDPVVEIIAGNETIREEIYIVNREFTIKPYSTEILANVSLTLSASDTTSLSINSIDKGVYRVVIDGKTYIIGSRDRARNYSFETVGNSGVIVSGSLPTSNEALESNTTRQYSNNTSPSTSSTGFYISIPDIVYAIAVAVASVLIAHFIVKKIPR